MYCKNCGKELSARARICPNCGEPTNGDANWNELSSLRKASYIIMLITTILCGAFIIPLAWMIPMTIMARKSEKLSVGFKICTLLFVNIISGILLLCEDD